MKKYAFIPSRDGKSETLSVLKEFLTSAGYDVKVLIGKSSIFEAYGGAVKEFNISAKDRIIMCHDDIEVLNNVKSFNEILDFHFEFPKSGFLGVAGAKVLLPHGVWWANYSMEHVPRDPNNLLSGAVFHGNDFQSIGLDHYGGYAKTVVMDGVFLAATGAVLNSIQLKQPKSFPGGWHFYDIFYTFQAFKKGFVNVTAPILLRHESGGNTSELYEDNRLSFIERYKNDLPAYA